jgi:hypothetical protein
MERRADGTTTRPGNPEAIVVATARRYRVPLLTANHATPERRRLWRGVKVIRACSD